MVAWSSSESEALAIEATSVEGKGGDGGDGVTLLAVLAVVIVSSLPLLFTSIGRAAAAGSPPLPASSPPSLGVDLPNDDIMLHASVVVVPAI